MPSRALGCIQTLLLNETLAAAVCSSMLIFKQKS